MECFLLGSGGMMPMPRRRLTSVLVRTDVMDCLMDAGEGVQVSFKELGVGIKRLGLIAVSHLHADHCLGLPGLLMLRAQVEDPGPLTIVGPRGIRRFVQHVRADLGSYIPYRLRFVELDPSEEKHGVALRDNGFDLFWASLRHSVPCVGYRIQQPDRPGRFHPEKARALGVEEGPLWGKLQRGQSVDMPGRGEVSPDDVMGPPRRGRAVAYVTDTRPCPTASRLLKGVDLAFVEGMFLPEHADAARRKEHMTAQEAAELAKNAGAKRLVLTHLSPRYHDSERPAIRDTARKTFPDAVVGRDLDRFRVSLTEEPAIPPTADS
jgi:ribonuclease Z